MPKLRLSGGGGSLTIESDDGPEPLYWQVTLTSGGLSASTRIALDAIRHTVAPIGEFFAGLAANWRGWHGVQRWGGPPIALSATHDGLGHVALTVDVQTNVYDEPDWQARATVHLEAGDLENAARDAAQLPAVVSGA